MPLDPLVNLSLKDAIAYDFFITNVKEIADAANTADPKSMDKKIAALARLSYGFAEIFCETREQFTETFTDD